MSKTRPKDVLLLLAAVGALLTLVFCVAAALTGRFWVVAAAMLAFTLFFAILYFLEISRGHNR